MRRVAVIGAGYVGLTVATCLAHLKHRVVCVDIDQVRIERLNRGEPPIVETGIEKLLLEGLGNGRLSFTINMASAVRDAEFVFLCVPTPQLPDGSTDLSFIASAVSEFAPFLMSGSIVVNKSTVPVGSTRIVERALARPDVLVASNPEFLREGSAVRDFLQPDRIVIGSDSLVATDRVASLYLGLGAPVIATDPASAETIKYAANAFLATKVSFVNAVAAVCEAVGADITEVVRGLSHDRRIGPEYLRPGPGWGGSCFPKDTQALIRIAEDAGYDFDLLRGVIKVNDEQLERVVRKIGDAVGGSLKGVTVAVWGLTFKALTDDLRDSPSLAVVSQLVDRGALIQAYDPTVTSPVTGIEIRRDPYAACEGAEVLAVLTEWDEFRGVDFDKVALVMGSRNVVDARNLLDGAALIRSGFRYRGIGRSL